METQRIEYIRKNRKNTGEKRGVLYCGVDPNDKNNVVVGFSLCNKMDRFDYINGQRVKGFGLGIAKKRAEKWTNHDDYFIQNSFTEQMIMDETCDLLFLVNPNPEQIVEVPPSIVDRLKIFIRRCKRYYKDKEFPIWVLKLEKNDEYTKIDLKEESVREYYEVC